MSYKNIIFIFFIFFIYGCESINVKNKKLNFEIENRYKNSGFALIYNDQLENIKENKLHNVKCLLKKINKTQVDLFISDHIDDLPLFNYSKSIILVNPDANLFENLGNKENIIKVYNF